MKDDAIVLAEAREIIEVLPVESQSDMELAKAIVGSLQAGVDRHEVQIKALDLAHKRLEAKVNKGFELFAKKVNDIETEAKIDRVHAQYAKQTAEQARAIAEQAWAKTQEVAIGVVKAEAKAETARDLAKETRKGFASSIDPTWAMVFTAALIFIVLSMFTRVEKVPQSVPAKESQGSVIKCGVDVSCSYTGTPRPVHNN